MLPTNDLDLGPIDFPSTTTYHWPNFDLNATEGKDGVEIVHGPFQFALGVFLDNEKQQVKLTSLNSVQPISASNSV